MSRSHRRNTRYNQPQPVKTTDAVLLDRSITTRDAFANALARLGFGSANLMEGTEYVLTRLTKNYQLLNTLYREHWIIRKIIDTIPEDMCKNWYQINNQVQPDLLDRFTKAERRCQVKAKILKGLKWGRLYGGAAAIIIIEGQDNLEEPLDYTMIMPGSFKGLMILDRWSGISPGTELVDDVSSPEFGLPVKYQITTRGNKVFWVHHSRVIRFLGRPLPYWEELAEVYWGASEVEIVCDELKKRDNTSWNIAHLVFLANLRVFKIGDLGQMLSTGNAQVQNNLYQVMQAQNMLMSNMGMHILDKDDDFSTHQYTFTGLNDIYESFMLDIAGACEIPVTRLFGRAPAGLNATGESDMQNYYDSIGEKQDTQLRPVLDKLLPIMAVSEWGFIPNDLDYEFNPIGNPSDKDKAELADKKTKTVVDVFNSGIIGRKTALMELRQLKDVTGMFSNITDKMIDQADDDTNQGEMLGGDLFGGLGGAKPGLSFEQPKGSGGFHPKEPKNTQDSKSIFDKIKGFFVKDGEFREEDHPRSENGQFGNKGESVVKLDKKAQKHYNKLLIGLKTDSGHVVNSISYHVYERAAVRNIDAESMKEALLDSTVITPVREDAQGRRSIKIFGRNRVVIAFNPDNNRIGSLWWREELE